MTFTRILLLATVALAGLCSSASGQQFRVGDDHRIRLGSEPGAPEYLPRFTVLCHTADPQIAMRPAGIENVQYNVATWLSERADLVRTDRKDDQTGDGFDDAILDGAVESRTADLFRSGKVVTVTPIRHSTDNGVTHFTYPDHPLFSLEAELSADPATNYPTLTYRLRAKAAGHYSVGFTGFQGIDPTAADEIWQPLIWQEKRFPDRSYITLAFRCPVPSALVAAQGTAYGVVAHPSEFPFDPLPTAANSRFGVAVRTDEGLAAPMLFAPVLGGAGSQLAADARISFSAVLYTLPGNTTDALRGIAQTLYGFTSNRNNALGSLNRTIDRMNSYVLSQYSRFLDDAKGCTYSTDVPGAVKNVSSLNPLEAAILSDDPTMLTRRAYPVFEYVLSREKLLFCADTTQNIQFPSRSMNGPCCPISELTTLHQVLGGANPHLVDLARQEYMSTRVRNLDVVEHGQTWRNAMHLYRATGEQRYLRAAIEGADRYMHERIDTPASDFSDPEAGGFFFWTGFAPKWIDLLEMYELTGNDRYLQAAHRGAMRYTQYVWYCPLVPDTTITVNRGGKAPHYFYLKGKGHPQMAAPEESAPAWRLSEIGLTAESSGTSTGHRGIFMTNYAPWMLRLAHYTGDAFLARTANHAVIGRYRNFPGYHINTARTTVYEKEDYPLREHNELSVNSFHYNHIMPQITMLYDFLISQALYRSQGKVDFPGAFIEGYAYLQSKFYGHAPGLIYGHKAHLWMPAGLICPDNEQLNYLTAYGDDGLYVVLMNQHSEPVETLVRLDCARTGHCPDKEYPAQIIGGDGTCSGLHEGGFRVRVAGDGVTAVRIGLEVPVRPRLEALFAHPRPWSVSHAASSDDAVRCIKLTLGEAIDNVYIYLTRDDSRLREVCFEIDGKRYTDTAYPFECTAPVDGNNCKIQVTARTHSGETRTWEPLELSQ